MPTHQEVIALAVTLSDKLSNIDDDYYISLSTVLKRLDSDHSLVSDPELLELAKNINDLYARWSATTDQFKAEAVVFYHKIWAKLRKGASPF